MRILLYIEYFVYIEGTRNYIADFFKGGKQSFVYAHVCIPSFLHSFVYVSAGACDSVSVDSEDNLECHF